MLFTDGIKVATREGEVICLQKSSVLNLAFAISLRPAMSSSFFFASV